MDCYTCKKHFSQGGKCSEAKKNCLFYEKEPRGRMIHTNISFKMNEFASTPIVRHGTKVIFEDNGREVEMTVIKINWINLSTMICNIDAKYYENEQPHFEKVKKFKVIK